MENIPSENPGSAALPERTIETALILRTSRSMLDAGGGRFQLLTNATAGPDGAPPPVGAAGPPAEG